jgi:lactate permease
MLLLFSLAPFLLFLLLLLWPKIPLLVISMLTLILTTLLAVFYWQIAPLYLGASILKGFFVALDIFFIIFGAVFFLEILKKIGIIDNLCRHLSSLSGDYRVQVILLAWFLENFIEGTAGFGTPSAVAAPLLVGLGLTPIASAIVALLGNSTSVAFGAAGTPIRIGFAGLEAASVPFDAALVGMVGFIVPVFMLWFITRDKVKQKANFFEALPFAVWSGIAFVVPALATVLLGQEFPSILGAVIGMAIIFITIRLKLFMPKTTRRLRAGLNLKPNQPLAKVLFPYGLLIALLLVGKFAFGTNGLAVNFVISHKFSLFNPGFAFLVASLPVIVWFLKDKIFALSSLKTAFVRTLQPFLVIVAMSALVQIMIYSGHNASGIMAPLDYLAGNIKTVWLPFLSPFIGAFGSFLTGSATISNIMFGKLLVTASGLIGLNAAKVLALELTGAAAGNMIALADILSAEAVLGLKEKTRMILKGVIVPCLIYLLLLGLIGLLFVV